MILTDVGRHIDTPTPCKPLKRISSFPEVARLDANMLVLVKRVPRRLTRRGPIWSAIEPERRRQQQVVRE